jgi:formate hydrogenlyase subunit 4
MIESPALKLALLLPLKIAGLFLLAPLFQGLVKRLKAVCQGRRGPPILQPYADFFKLLRKQTVVSREVSWVFHAAPLISFAAILTAALMVPWIDRSAWGYFADLLLFVYLLAIPRFMMALAGLDAAGAFGGMASSREMAVSALVEPALLLSLLTLALPAHSLRLENLMLFSGELPLFTPAGLLAAFAFFLVLLAEVGRIPVDNPDTHLELTMIHEGMILEYSGPKLALLHLNYWLKQFTLVLLLVNAFAPMGMLHATGGLWWEAGLFFVIKCLVSAVMLALTESGLAKLRLFQMMDLMGFSFILSVTALLFVAIGR